MDSLKVVITHSNSLIVLKDAFIHVGEQIYNPTRSNTQPLGVVEKRVAMIPSISTTYFLLFLSF